MSDERLQMARQVAFEEGWVIDADKYRGTWCVYESIWDLDEGRNVLGEGATPDEALLSALPSEEVGV
jgi:hypothetical protein